jgi:hypothetical protein
MPVFLWSAITWLLREVVLKFVVFTVVSALVAFFVPLAVGYLTPFIGTGNLTALFFRLPSGVWYILDFFALDFGLPLLISAYVARFLIRRLPVIG